MKTNIQTTNKLTMIYQMAKDSKFQILEFERIDGGTDAETLAKIQTLNDKNIRLRQIRIILEDSILYIQNDKVSYYFGEIEVENRKSKPMSLSKKIFTGKLLDEYEDTIKPLYHGTGEIFLKPQFDNYALIELENEEVVVYDNNFIAAEGTVSITPVMENDKTAYKINGSGILVLEIPVPQHEIFKCKLFGNTLKVSGNLVVLHQGDVQYSSEIDSQYSEEENAKKINVYSGTGEVWVIPTNDVYEEIKKCNLTL